MAIRRPPTTFSDSITGADLASDIAISTTGNIATTGSGTLTSAGAFTASGGIANAGTITAGTLGSSVVFPTGHVLQAHSATYGGAQTTNKDWSAGDTTANWEDITDLTITLTPSSATNYLVISGAIQGNNLTASYGFAIRLYASGGGTDGWILNGQQTGSRRPVHAGGPCYSPGHGIASHAIGGRVRLNESVPNWSSGALTVKVQFSTNNPSYLAIMNRASSQANNSDYTTPLSYFTVMEVVG